MTRQPSAIIIVIFLLLWQCIMGLSSEGKGQHVKLQKMWHLR